jgi:hypothetical protein
MSIKVTSILIALGVLVGGAVGAPAGAQASSLRVIGSSHSSGDFATTATSASKHNAHAVYMRGYGHGLSGFAAVACSHGFSVGSKGTTLSHMVSGRLYRLRMSFAGNCTVTASLGGSGSIRLQILA